jgi:hypothetical protein
MVPLGSSVDFCSIPGAPFYGRLGTRGFESFCLWWSWFRTASMNWFLTGEKRPRLHAQASSITGTRWCTPTGNHVPSL